MTATFIRKKAPRADELMEMPEERRWSAICDALRMLEDDTEKALAGGLTLANLRIQRNTIAVQTGATVEEGFPVRVALNSKMGMPLRVEVARIQNQSSPTSPWTAAVMPFWEPDGQGAIVIGYMSGLSANSTYLVDLLIWS